MKIAEKLLAIQCSLKAPKNQYNNFGKYKYRSLEDILEALKPLLKKHSALLRISDDIIEVGGRVYVKSTATLSSEEEMITATALAREAETKKGMDEAQITGAASSYARKYCLNGLFAIDDTRDADTYNKHDDPVETIKKTFSAKTVKHEPQSNEQSPQEPKKYNINPTKKISVKQVAWLEKIIASKEMKDADIFNLLSPYGAKSIEDLTMGVFGEILEKAKSWYNIKDYSNKEDIPF
jgi:hypothetical protein